MPSNNCGNLKSMFHYKRVNFKTFIAILLFAAFSFTLFPSNRVFLDSDVIYKLGGTGIVLFGAIAWLLARKSTRKSIDDSRLRYIFITLFSVVGFLTLPHANNFLDFSDATMHETNVIESFTSESPTTHYKTYFANISSWRSGRKVETIQTYTGALQLGKSLIIRSHPGAFGFEWINVDY